MTLRTLIGVADLSWVALLSTFYVRAATGSFTGVQALNAAIPQKKEREK